MNVVITGTSRGIGLELTRQALKRGDRVLAIAREPARVHDELGRGAQLETLALDVSAADAGERLERALEEWPHVDVLINNAGIWRDGRDDQDFLDSFKVNALAPLRLMTAALPWLRRAPRGRVLNVTSRLASIADNQSGGYHAYRASKAALNMLTRSFDAEHRDVIAVVIEPGWVQTDMGGAGAPVSVETSARGIWNVAEKIRDRDRGRFFGYRGDEVPW